MFTDTIRTASHPQIIAMFSSSSYTSEDGPIGFDEVRAQRRPTQV